MKRATSRLPANPCSQNMDLLGGEKPVCFIKNPFLLSIFFLLLITFSGYQSLSNYWASNLLNFYHIFSVAFYGVWPQANEVNEMASKTVERSKLYASRLCSLRGRLGWNCRRSDVTKNLTLPDIAKDLCKVPCSFKGVSKDWAISSEELLENSVTGNPKQKRHRLFFGLAIHKRKLNN